MLYPPSLKQDGLTLTPDERRACQAVAETTTTRAAAAQLGETKGWVDERLRTAAPKLHVDASPRVKAQRWYFVECGGSTGAFDASTPADTA